MKRTLVSLRNVLFLGLTLPGAFLLSACNKSLGTIDFSGPIDMQWTMLRVYAQNSTSSEIRISYQGHTALSAPVGQTVYLTPYISPNVLPSSDWFFIQRGSMTLARVSFQPLRYPDKKGDVKDTTVAIGEPSPGLFTATVAEPSWIRIVSVTPMP
jgi:hypothetical protein